MNYFLPRSCFVSEASCAASRAVVDVLVLDLDLDAAVAEAIASAVAAFAMSEGHHLMAS